MKKKSSFGNSITHDLLCWESWRQGNEMKNMLHCGVLQCHAVYHAHKKSDCRDRMDLVTLSAKAR